MKALVVDDEGPIRDTIAEVLRADGWEVSEAESAERAFELLQREAWALVFCDVQLGGDSGHDGFSVLRRFTKEQPAAQFILMTGHGSAAGALDATSLGAYDYLMKPFGVEEVLDISRAVRRGIEKRLRPGTSGELPPLSAYSASDIDLVGRSAAFVEVMKLVGRVAATNLPVLITGESGTGKELVARAIHGRSPRVTGAFVAVNCGAIPSELIESELFGHVRGSFTGAVAARAGLWEEADGGAVFLDEITETTLAFQVKLLRVLQQGEIRRVGSNQTLHVNVRVIAATNRDIESEVRDGRFRQDLLYRLNAVTLYLPPLRERREDILPLARHFANRHTAVGKQCVSFSPEAIQLLEDYYWPGNIRELENAIVRAVALCDEVIRPEDLPERIRNSAQTTNDTAPRIVQANAVRPPPPTTPPEEYLLPLAAIEERHVARVLAYTNGNKQAAARILGIDRTTLQRMLKRRRPENQS